MAKQEEWYSKILTIARINWVIQDFTPRRESHDKFLSALYVLKNGYEVSMEAVIEGDTINIDFIQQSDNHGASQISVAILNANGCKYALVKSNLQHLPRCCHRFSVNVNISCIDQNKRDFLFNDSLTLLCEFEIFEKNETVQIELQSKTVFLAKDVKIDGLQFFNNPVLSDVTIITGNQTYYGHKSIMAMRCPFFRAMFTKETKDKVENEVIIKDDDPDAFEHLLYFIYTATVEDTVLVALAPKIMIVADKYQLCELVSLCENYLMNNVNLQNALEVFKVANTLKKANLADVALKFLATNAEKIMKNVGENQQFENLEIQSFLKSCQNCFKLNVQQLPTTTSKNSQQSFNSNNVQQLATTTSKNSQQSFNSNNVQQLPTTTSKNSQQSFNSNNQYGFQIF